MDSPVFGCHYDEGRITRVVSGVRTDQQLAYRSTLKYRTLEKESGISIFSEVGYGTVGAVAEDDRATAAYATELDMSDEFCRSNGIRYEVLDEESTREKWRYFVPPNNSTGRFVKKLSGHLSIRNLVTAAKQVARRNGVCYVDGVVTSARKCGDIFEINLATGVIIKSNKLVVACGSFTNFFDFPLHNPIDLQLTGHSVMKFELNEGDRELMKDFPSMNYRYDPTNCDVYLYILPPITYPNGKHYIKLGHTVNYPSEGLETQLHDIEGVKEWYCMEDHLPAREHFTKYFRQMFPGIEPVSTELNHCVMALTRTGKQYIGFDSEGLLVATGGNGASAKMGLEIGFICAQSIVEGSWDYDLDEKEFRVIYKD